MVEIIDNYIKILFIAIYAPNDKQEEFYKKLHMKIIGLDYVNIIMMGDFNGIVDNKLDYIATTTKQNRKALPRSFFKMTDELTLKDIWRERNLKTKQYTFYSNRHLSWSRLDMIWISTELMSNIQETNIETSRSILHQDQRRIF